MKEKYGKPTITSEHKCPQCGGHEWRTFDVHEDNVVEYAHYTGTTLVDWSSASYSPGYPIWVDLCVNCGATVTT